MKFPNIFCVCMIVFIGLFVPKKSIAEISVGTLEQISSKRVARTEIEFQFKLHVTNVGNAKTNITAVVSGGGLGTTILEGELAFQDMSANATGISTNTFTLRHNRRHPFDQSGLQFEFSFNEDQPLTVNIGSPASLITVGVSPIQVSGTVSRESAALTLNGVEITHSNGNFLASVGLEEGHNTIVARVVDNGEQRTDSISVSLDMTPPQVTVDSHVEGQTVFNDKVIITGLVNDVVRGTVVAAQANVTVNGQSATIANRSYSASNISLLEGENSITVIGSDQVGNMGIKTLKLIYKGPQGKRLELVDGQAQSTTIGSPLPAPLVVRVLNDALQPVEGASVIFRVTQGAGKVGLGTQFEGRAFIATTDSDGLATTDMQVGARAGSLNHKVRAVVVGYENDVIFAASASGSVGNLININSGNNQRGVAGDALAEPFVTVVTDAGANVVANARVAFSVSAGAGNFDNAQTTIEDVTDSDGRATAQYVLGNLVGIDAQRVTATLIDAPQGQPISAGFTASAFVPGDPGQTSISGVVLDNQDTPVPGTTIRIDGTTREAVADEQGQFNITQVPAGPVHLLVDGSTATVEGEWPTLSYNLVTIAGVENPLPAPIYMVKLDTGNAVFVGTNDAVITLPEVPGFALKVAAGSVTFPDGSREGLMSVTPVNASKVPMPPPNGMQPQLIVTIQPTGTRFDPPAALTLPNVDGHPPGAHVEMYSYDHDMEEFVSIGLGTVAEDGGVIESDPGVGVLKAGWHCGSQPGGAGCLHNCPTCLTCVAPQCVCDIAITDCNACKGANCDGCNGPDCETCEGAGCDGCTGPDCKTCTGSDCPDCIGPDCQSCTGADCQSNCEGVDCDTDGDGVPDINDKCPGFDDNIDSDYDGIPDGCDTVNNCPFTIISQTLSPLPLNKTRNTIGVCEIVEIRTDPSTNVSWKLVGGGVLQSLTGNTTKLQAGDLGGNRTVTAMLPNGVQCDVNFKVVLPENISINKAQGRPTYHIPNTASAGFLGEITILPTNASFSGIQLQEQRTLPTEATGFYASNINDVHAQGAWFDVNSNSSINFVSVRDSIFTIKSPPFHPNGGIFSWDIPWHYRCANGFGKEHFFRNIRHRQTATNTGKVTITKGGESVTHEASDPKSCYNNVLPGCP